MKWRKFLNLNSSKYIIIRLYLRLKILKKNILIPKLGQRVDMLNLLKLAQENGFVYSKKCLSLFTVRSDQFGKKQKQDTLIKELIFLKKISKIL